MNNKYSMGYTGGITVGDLPINVAHPGHVYYVASGDTVSNTPTVKNRKAPDDGNDGSFLAPFKTLDYAIGQCTADRGDVIYVLPGYIDTLAAASAIDVDVDGVTIIGVGEGDKQPLIQFDDAAATFEVNADNVTIMGLHFAASVTVVAIGVDVKDGSDDFHISNCRFTSLGGTLTTDEFEDSLFITTSDRFVVENCYFDMDEGADSDSAIHLVGICLGGTIRNNYVTGDYAAACIESVTAAQEQLVIEDNTLINGVHSGLNTVAAISLLTGTTGVIQNNKIYTNVSAAATAAIVADGCFVANNTVSTTAEQSAIEPEAFRAGVLHSTSKTGVTDDATATLWTVTGTIDVHGIIVHTETAADSAVQVSCTTDCTTEALNATLCTAVEAQVLTAAGDTLTAANAGAVFAATEVPGDLTPTWPAPARVTAGTIQYTKGGTAGALVKDWTLLWTPVSNGATVA